MAVDWAVPKSKYVDAVKQPGSRVTSVFILRQ